MRANENGGISTRVQRQLRRLFVVLDVVRSTYYGQDISEINYRVRERTGSEICKRTTQRDLDLLTSLGFLLCDKALCDDCNAYKNVYCFNKRHPVAQVCADHVTEVA